LKPSSLSTTRQRVRFSAVPPQFLPVLLAFGPLPELPEEGPGKVCGTVNQCSFLGFGYDIIGGDPDFDHIDPGWKVPIFDPDWIIANGLGNEFGGCTYESEISSISGGGSAQTSQSQTTTISGSGSGKVGGWGVDIAFTGSASTSTMNKSAWSESMHFEEARATCTLWVAKLPPSASSGDVPGDVPVKFTQDFEQQVVKLPTAKGASSDKMLEKLMMDYGTHYTYAVTMGGMYLRRYTMSKSSWDTYQEDAKANEYSVEVGVEGAFSEYTGGLGHEKNAEATKAFQTATSSHQVQVLQKGSAPFVAGNLGAWAAGLDGHLAPVFVGSQNELRPITELLTPTNFPGLDPGVQTTAEEFAGRLCTSEGSNLGYPACTTHAVDPLVDVPLVGGSASTHCEGKNNFCDTSSFASRIWSTLSYSSAPSGNPNGFLLSLTQANDNGDSDRRLSALGCRTDSYSYVKIDLGVNFSLAAGNGFGCPPKACYNAQWWLSCTGGSLSTPVSKGSTGKHDNFYFSLSECEGARNIELRSLGDCSEIAFLEDSGTYSDNLRISSALSLNGAS